MRGHLRPRPAGESTSGGWFGWEREHLVCTVLTARCLRTGRVRSPNVRIGAKTKRRTRNSTDEVAGRLEYQTEQFSGSSFA